MNVVVLLTLMALPFLEIFLLVQIGSWIGLWPTLGLIVGSALLGIAIIVQHGFSAAVKAQQAVLRGETLLAPIVDGAMIVSGGVLLVTPGPIGDAVGLLLLIPPTRRLVARAIARSIFGRFDVDVQPSADGQARNENDAARSARGRGPIIDGQFKRVDDPKPDPDQTRP